jgi:hypothetical protein
MNVAYATLVSEGYWTLEMDLILGALIIESYLLGLTQDIDHFDREIEPLHNWDRRLWMSVYTN